MDSIGEVGMSGRGTPDIPRFGALEKDNTPSPAECSWMIDSTMLLLELYGGGRKAGQGLGCSFSPGGCYYLVASSSLRYLSVPLVCVGSWGVL